MYEEELAFANELADVPFAIACAIGTTRIPHMRIVRPHNYFRVSTFSTQVGNQSLKCLGHMAITQVPGRNAPTKHATVVFLGILCKPCILLSVEKFVLSDPAIAFGKISCMLLQFDELGDDLIFA